MIGDNTLNCRSDNKYPSLIYKETVILLKLGNHNNLSHHKFKFKLCRGPLACSVTVKRSNMLSLDWEGERQGCDLRWPELLPCSPALPESLVSTDLLKTTVCLFVSICLCWFPVLVIAHMKERFISIKEFLNFSHKSFPFTPLWPHRKQPLPRTYSESFPYTSLFLFCVR